MHTALYVLTRALLWCGGDTATYSDDWKCNCWTGFTSYLQNNNHWTEIWQYERILWPFLSRNLLEELRKTMTIYLDRNPITPNAFIFVVFAECNVARAWFYIVSAGCWQICWRNKQRNKPHILPVHVVHFTDWNVIKIYDPFTQFTEIQSSISYCFYSVQCGHWIIR